MKHKYHVTLPIEVDDVVYHAGAVVELDDETAGKYAHALIRLEAHDGGNK